MLHLEFGSCLRGDIKTKRSVTKHWNILFLEYVKEFSPLFGIRKFKDFKSYITSKTDWLTLILINKSSLNTALCQHTDENWQYKIPTFKEFSLTQEVKYINNNSNKFPEHLLMQSAQWMLQVRSAIGIQWTEKLLPCGIQKRIYRKREKFIWVWGNGRMPSKLGSAI